MARGSGRVTSSGRPGTRPGDELAHRRLREWLEVNRGEVAATGAPVGAALDESLGATR